MVTVNSIVGRRSRYPAPIDGWLPGYAPKRRRVHVSHRYRHGSPAVWIVGLTIGLGIGVILVISTRTGSIAD